MHSEAAERARAAGANQWISADPVDVENWASLVIRFEDGSRGSVLVSDAGLGGLNTRVTAYMTDGVIKANMTANDSDRDLRARRRGVRRRVLHREAGDPGRLEPAQLRRGLVPRLQPGDRRLRRRLHEGREPRSGIDLAVACVDVIYAAYLSAEAGRQVEL